MSNSDDYPKVYKVEIKIVCDKFPYDLQDMSNVIDLFNDMHSGCAKIILIKAKKENPPKK